MRIDTRILLEDTESENQDLSFNELTALCARRGIPSPCGPEALRTASGRWTNLALLLSDQCPWSTVVVSDGRELRIGGPVPSQVSAAVWTVMTSGDRPGASKRMSAAALSEVVLNAACHRSYRSPGPTVVAVLPDSVTVESPGGMTSCGCRAGNPGLTGALDRLGLKDWSAHGIDSVMRAYRSC